MPALSRACPPHGAGEPPPPEPSSRAAGGPSRWISGLVAGAGRLISSVLSPGSPDSDTGSSSDEDESIDDIDEPYNDIDELNMNGNKTRQANDNVYGSPANISKVESKDAIEQLLMQETFSRDECVKLTKIIQSRVAELHSTDNVCSRKELPNGSSAHVMASPQIEKSWSSERKLMDSSPYSSHTLGSLSAGFSAWQLRTPELHNTAVLEAKKWVAEKKSSSSKTDIDIGPCSFNTDTLHELEGEADSPVVMAKSYMLSLPPWQSSSVSNAGYMLPPPHRSFYKDESPISSYYSSSSSKVRKRSFLASGIGDPLDDIRMVRLKSIENKLMNSPFSQLDPSATYNGILSCSDNKCSECPGDANSSPAPVFVDVSEKQLLNSSEKNISSDGFSKKAVEESCMLNTANPTNVTDKNPVPPRFPSEYTHSDQLDGKAADESHPVDPDSAVTMPFNSVSGTADQHEEPALVAPVQLLSPGENDGNCFCNVEAPLNISTPEHEVTTLKEIKSSPSKVDLHAPNEEAQQIDVEDRFRDGDSVPSYDTETQGDCGQALAAANRPSNKSLADCLSEAAQPDQNVMHIDGGSSSHSQADIRDGDGSVHTIRTDDESTDGSIGGSAMKLPEPASSDASRQEEGVAPARGRKVVAIKRSGGKRGRGRARGKII